MGCAGVLVACVSKVCVWIYLPVVTLTCRSSRRVPLDDVPTESEEATKDWLIKLYQEKVGTCVGRTLTLPQPRPLTLLQCPTPRMRFTNIT